MSSDRSLIYILYCMTMLNHIQKKLQSKNKVTALPYLLYFQDLALPGTFSIFQTGSKMFLVFYITASLKYIWGTFFMFLER